MYNTMYQPNIDRINAQMNELEKMKQQLQQPAPITQNFQLTPVNREVIRYANSIEEVQRDMVIGDTPYFSKDLSVVWIKNAKGEIKTYELTEIIPKDERDLLIESLQMQVNQLRKEVQENAKSNVTDTNEPTSNEKSTSVQPSRTTKKK